MRNLHCKEKLITFQLINFFRYPTNPDYDYVSVKIYDYDSTTNNDLLGEVEISCGLITSRPPAEQWYQLQRKRGKSILSSLNLCFFSALSPNKIPNSLSNLPNLMYKI